MAFLHPEMTPAAFSLGAALSSCGSEGPPPPSVLAQGRRLTEALLSTSWSHQSYRVKFNMTVLLGPHGHRPAAASLPRSPILCFHPSLLASAFHLAARLIFKFFNRFFKIFLFNKYILTLENMKNTKKKKSSRRETKIRFWIISYRFF